MWACYKVSMFPTQLHYIGSHRTTKIQTKDYAAAGKNSVQLTQHFQYENGNVTPTLWYKSSQFPHKIQCHHTNLDNSKSHQHWSHIKTINSPNSYSGPTPSHMFQSQHANGWSHQLNDNPTPWKLVSKDFGGHTFILVCVCGRD